MKEVAPHVITNAIMGKMYDVLTNGDETVPQSADNYFSWCTPGIPVQPESFDFLTQGFTAVLKQEAVDTVQDALGGDTPAPEEGKSKQPALTPGQIEQLLAQDQAKLFVDAANLARLVDFVPDVGEGWGTNQRFRALEVMSNEGNLSEIYARTLRFSQVKHAELNQEEKDNIKRFRELLTAVTKKKNLVTNEEVEVSGPSPLVQLYNSKMSAYEDAALEYNNSRIAAQVAQDRQAVSYFALNGNILRHKVRAALDDWITNGYKEDYEGIAAYIAQIEGRDLTLLKEDYKDDLRKATLTGPGGNDFYYTALVPGDFVDSTGWTEFTFNSGDIDKYAVSESEMHSRNVSGGGGFMGIGASASHSSSNQRQEFHGYFNQETFYLKFQIAQVSIARPWFHPSYLQSKSWRFSANSDMETDHISDGGKPPNGLMPAYPTSVVFIRNLHMHIGENSSFSDFLHDAESSSTGGGGGGSWGGFTFGGSASRSDAHGKTDASFGYHWDNQSMTVPGMQIAGFKCHVISDKSPNPSPDIKKWV